MFCFFFVRDGLFYVIKLMLFMDYILAAWCFIPVSISKMYTGAEEEGLKLCNHHGKCWRGSRLWQQLLYEKSSFPESRSGTEASPSLLLL